MSNSQESDQKRFFLPCSMPRNGKRGTWPLMSKSITQENTVKKRFRVTITGKAHFLQKKKNVSFLILPYIYRQLLGFFYAHQKTKHRNSSIFLLLHLCVKCSSSRFPSFYVLRILPCFGIKLYMMCNLFVEC